MLDIPKKSWLAITDHAKTCVVGDYKLYSYYSQTRTANRFAIQFHLHPRGSDIWLGKLLFTRYS